MALCGLCRKELSYCGGMTNLSDHLMRIHPLKYTTEADKNKVSTAKIDTFVNKIIYSKSHAKKINNLMAEMLVLDLRPAATVEGVGFRRLINYVPRTKLQSPFCYAYGKMYDRKVRSS